MDPNTPETVEIPNPAAGETLIFTTQADADAYALTGDETLVADVRYDA